MKLSISEVYEYALSLGCEAYTDVPMRDFTTFKIGGPASVMLIPDSDAMLSKIVGKCFSLGEKPFIIGNGSNMLVSDYGLNRVVINMCRKNADIRLVDDETVCCDAGVTMSKLCNFALEHSLSGLEFAFGIPGSAGGAAYMNAGAYGGEIKDVLVSCSHIEPDGKTGTLLAEQLDFRHRHSAYEDNGFIITSLTLKLRKGEKSDIKAKMSELLQRRKDKQPLEFPSAGSTFKRPEGHFAGTLIEQCGLKGTSVGGAEVSRKHAGFIINKGNATASDVMNLIMLVKNTVYNETGVILEPEVRLIEE